MLAEIITIGDELLIGQVIDTNSAWIAQQLNAIGIAVKQITSVSDSEDHIIEALHSAQKRAQLVLMTGGLGPTKDDITKKTLAKFFDAQLVSNNEVLKHVSAFFEKRNLPMLAINNAQALVPDNCEVLHNAHGTAPGMWFEHQDCIFVSMPGVPFEMKYLMEEKVLPKLQSRWKLPFIIHHTILTAGLGESFLADRISSVEEVLPSHIKLAYLPSLGTLRLRLSAQGTDLDTLKAEIAYYAKAIVALIAEYVVVEEDMSLEQAIMNILKQKNQTFSTAESCTGGYIAHMITRNPGCSATYMGGAVTYSNELKKSVLGVSISDLEQFGAVSEPVVKQMAEGALQQFGTDYSVSVSGIAGPDGGSPEKPVGMICIAAASSSKTVTKTIQLGNKRTQNIERATISVLTLLLQLIRENNA